MSGRRILRLTLEDVMQLIREKAGEQTPKDLRIIDFLPQDRSCFLFDIKIVVESEELTEQRYGQFEMHDISGGPVPNWRRYQDALPENLHLIGEE